MKLRPPSRVKPNSLIAVARQAGVSPSTVSRVITGHRRISVATREKVLSVVAKVGYRPDPRKRLFFSALHSGTRTIGFLADANFYSRAEEQDGFFSRLLVPVQRSVRLAGYHLLMAEAASGEEPDRDSPDAGAGGPDSVRIIPPEDPTNPVVSCVAEGRVDAVVFCGANVPLIRWISKQVPVVTLNFLAELPHVDVVIPNLKHAMRVRMEHLLALGHRRIAGFILRPTDEWMRREGGARCEGIRWQNEGLWDGYFKTCAQHDLAIPSSYVAPIQFGIGGDEMAVREFLDRVLACEAPPTAILTFDGYAAELIRQLAQRGLQVPQDVSVVGFDDLRRETPVPLTTYRQNFEFMAETAVKLLFERIKAPGQPARFVEIEGDFIVRESSGPCRAAGAKRSANDPVAGIGHPMGEPNRSSIA